MGLDKASNSSFLCIKAALPLTSCTHLISIRAHCLRSNIIPKGRMGRKAGGLYINPKKFGSLSKPCMKEMIAFLNCLALNQNSDEKCVRQKELLNTCMDAQTGKSRKPWGSINYHLQRLNRGRK
ncbi:hypothetical protein F0562_000936 [Nyssa sinensis]|uniref:IMS import disulfide relay-system CHCH-CHCH-like Cx9C domain-containing protein n=1 Tax=Nyssa sinensis TaxID=561372 RepID=A0A5J5C5P1_9ASTE|nr:hypothetical protein F0562_000936 [Nyssa sinensis]